MNRTTISLIELFNRFPDQESARSLHGGAAVARRYGVLALRGSRTHSRAQGRILPLQRLPGRLHRSHRHRHGAFPYPASEVALAECTCW